MGLIYTTVTLGNPRDRTLVPLNVQALADTGPVHLCIPEHVALQLKLESLHEREVTTADGKKLLCPYAGPVEVSCGNRTCYVGALVLGDEVLLGAVPMEDLDLVLCPRTRTITVNPDSPNIPTAKVK